MGGGVLRARGDRLSEVDRLEDGLDVIEDGRLGDLLDVVREEGLGACAKGTVGGVVGADVPAGPFGEADALLLPVGPDSANNRSWIVVKNCFTIFCYKLLQVFFVTSRGCGSKS